MITSKIMPMPIEPEPSSSNKLGATTAIIAISTASPKLSKQFHAKNDNRPKRPAALSAESSTY